MGPTRGIGGLLVAWAAALFFLQAACLGGASAETLRIGGSGDAVGGIALAAKAFREDHPEVRVVFSGPMGSTAGIRAAVAGKLDVALSSRPISPEERAMGGRETSYARTAVVFAANPGVPASGVTLFEIADILQGVTRQWGNGIPVRLVLRHHSSRRGANELEGMFPALAAAHADAHRREGMIVVRTEKECADRIEKTPGAFGITSLSLVVSEKRRVKVLAVDGVAPSTETVRNGSYPYSRTFRLVTGPSVSAAAGKFDRFLRTPKAMAILVEAGHVELP